MTTVQLAIETSTPTGSVAVGARGSVLAEIVLGERSRHSEALLPAIDNALKIAGATRQDVDAVVVGGGPGSFTGLRISAASGKAIAHALNVPFFAYSGLAALAAGTGVTDRPVCALFDARRGEVYCAIYRFAGFDRMETMLEPAPRHINDVLSDASSLLFVGDGAHQNAHNILDAGGLIAPKHLSVPRAGALLFLQTMSPNAGRVEDVPSWEPLYLRESGAERMRAR